MCSVKAYICLRSRDESTAKGSTVALCGCQDWSTIAWTLEHAVELLTRVCWQLCPVCKEHHDAARCAEALREPEDSLDMKTFARNLHEAVNQGMITPEEAREALRKGRLEHAQRTSNPG